MTDSGEIKEVVNGRVVESEQKPDVEEVQVGEKKEEIPLSIPWTEKDQEVFDKLAPEDQKYFRVQQAMGYITIMNNIEIQIRMHQAELRKLIPCSDEEFKIIISRIEDIKQDEIDSLSFGFIKQVFMIDTKELKPVFPEVGKVDNLQFYKVILHFIKNMDTMVDEANTKKEEVKKLFMDNIPDDVKQIVSTFEGLTEYTHNYFIEKLNSDKLDDNERKAIETTLKFSDYGITMEPIYENLKSQIDKKSANSIIHSYHHNMESIMKGAVKALHAQKLQFPFHLFNNLEQKLFGPDEYKGWDNLLTFIIGRYIRFRGNSIDHYDKIFFAQLFSNLTTVCRANEKQPHTKLIESIKPNVKRILDLVLGRV